MKNKELIAFFKFKKNLKSDIEVAYVFKQTQSIIPGWNTERRPIPNEIKFRLLDHIEITPDIKKVAACFIDINEHMAQMQEDLDRIEEIKKKDQPVQQKYTNQREIDRIEQLQIKRKISDEELAVLLETTVLHLKSVKEGEAVLNTVSKAVLYLALKGNDAIKRFIDLLPIKDETKQMWKDTNDTYVKKNLTKRLAK